jgi:hypothetical protein
MSRVFSFLGRFLELRLRAFVYACFALVGYILGVITTTNLAVALLEKAS